jgi:PEGA domain
MRARSFVLLISVSAALLAPDRAPAQPAPPAAAPKGDVVKRADAIYKQGVLLYSEKKWTDAEAAFRAAWELNPTFDVAYNLGSTEYQLGKYRDAADHLSRAVRDWPLLKATSSLRQTAQQRLAESRAQVAALTVKVNVERAEVLVDGKPAGRSPLALEVFVTAGTHAVMARLEGYEDATAPVQVAKGEAQTVTLTLAPVAMPPVPTATATSNASQTATAVPTAPPTSSAVPPPPRERPSAPIVVAGGSAMLAAIVAGAVLAGVANSKGADANAKLATLPLSGRAGQCQSFASTCSRINNDLHALDTLSDASVGTFVGAGAIGLATLLYALLPRKVEPSAGMRVTPLVGSGHGGVAVVGAW